MKKSPKHPFIFLIVLTVIIVGAVFFYNPSDRSDSDSEKPEKEIAFSALAENIQQDKVEKVEIQGDNITIINKDETENETRLIEPDFTQSLINLGVTPEQITQLDVRRVQESAFARSLPYILPIVFVILSIFLIVFLLRGAQRSAGQAFNFGKARTQLFGGKQGKKQQVTFKDIAGEEEAIEELKEIVEFLKTPKRFLSMGAKIPKGVMLMGPPGTGKTLLARAVSGEAGVPFYSTSGSEFVEMFVGVGAARVRNLFENAKKTAPSIIFLDEIDAVGRLRGAGLGGGNDEREQTLNQILSEMDGFEQGTNVIVIAATNRPDVLDPALLRPGRFDRRVLIDLPDLKGRQEVLRIHSKNKPMGKKINLDRLAARTPGFSGADLANLVNEAAILATRRNKKFIDQQDLYDSIEKVLLGPERKARVYTKKDKETAAFHEAGHALVATLLPKSDPVHKISIISRGRAGGYTLKLPETEKSFKTFSEFEAELAVMLGGYASEEITFKELTTGASNDLQVATDLARNMVTRYGMSKKLGPVVFGVRDEAVFLGKELSERKNYSEEVAQSIDSEVRRLIQEAHTTATQLIQKNKTKLNTIAQALLEKETLEKDEFEELMNIQPNKQELKKTEE